MFTFYVMCENHRRISILITDYLNQYPEEILVHRKTAGSEYITQIDGTRIKFVSETDGPSKIKGIREDIYTEFSFREMYQIY